MVEKQTEGKKHTFNLYSRPFPFGRMMIRADGDQSHKPSLLDQLPHRQKDKGSSDSLFADLVYISVYLLSLCCTDHVIQGSLTPAGVNFICQAVFL